jgi:hypothetical protein
MNLDRSAPTEETFRAQIGQMGWDIKGWTVKYGPASTILLLRCELQWKTTARNAAEVPPGLSQLRATPGVTEFRWEQ